MLAYLALRLAAIEALTGATIAGDRLYDSRQFPLDGIDSLDTGPSLCVYTEEGRGRPYGSARTDPAETHVWLVIEAVVLVAGSLDVTGPDGNPQTIDGATTAIPDRDHEAMVDLLVSQVRRRLSIGGAVDYDDAATLFRAARVGIDESEDMPQRTTDKAVRLAGRTLRFRAKVHCDAWPAAGTVPASALPEPLASLAPRFVLPSSLDVLATVSASVHPPGALPAALTGIDMTIGLGRPPPTPPDLHAPVP
ncbi:hypothetical protein EYW49_20580 [Siculibacillus lacustris]|uniref:Uncharacterized protein n=1 Tax=Siculibacillus lacustris TaxID=1549641 RepID=A0A4Q9VEV6_9HYPH|nr:hypothetical protein [Siculibacillus lacustris]TBW33358.1 hypothetical protein EYW49_20580 [Siculibacillus lacustris]